MRTQLEALDLHSCNITDTGASSILTAVISQPNLHHLNLRANYLSDASIQHISDCVTTANHLQHLNVQTNDFTPEGEEQLERLAQAYPGTVIAVKGSDTSLEEVCVLM